MGVHTTGSTGTGGDGRVIFLALGYVFYFFQKALKHPLQTTAVRLSPCPTHPRPLNATPAAATKELRLQAVSLWWSWLHRLIAPPATSTWSLKNLVMSRGRDPAFRQFLGQFLTCWMMKRTGLLTWIQATVRWEMLEDSLR
ncbi:expressed unknown protein [Seminavis robusta]|uniref:Uncharacterized protein n=1 Tax=Seminavis robusta TaxID=568900 RepID=A0A9N8DZH1_9STRA|nr:expressed unknown protein [Seminavis robusta]|eukprot:Sro501_g155391.1  (141) ;mRNA; f:5588-6010